MSFARRETYSPTAAVIPSSANLTQKHRRGQCHLTVDLRIPGVNVIVFLELAESRSAASIPLTLAARKHSDWFPAFNGVVRCEEQGVLSSRLRLAGNYDLSLAAVGTIVDRDLLCGAAERSLVAFVERLRADVLDEIRRSEFEIREHEGRQT